MDQNTLNTTNIKLYDITDGEYLALNPSALGATSVTVTPDANLEAEHDYRLEVTSGVKDLAGNSLTTTSYNFFYGISAPTVVGGSKSPVGSNVYNKITASGGHDAFKFRAQFSAAVDATTVNNDTVKLMEVATEDLVDTTVSYEVGSRYVVVTPKADLKEDTEYKVVIDGVKTSKGLKVSKDTTTFTTGDFTAPTIVSSTPANAAEGVKVDANMIVNFSEKMDASKLALGTDVLLYDVTGKADVNYNDFIATLSQDGKVLTIKPAAGKKLEVNKTYRLTVKKTAADVATPANTLEADYKVLFNTEVATATKLSSVQVGTSYDKDNKKVESGLTNATAANKLYFNFDKALKTDSGSYVLHDLVKVEKQNANGTYTALTTDNTASSADEVKVVLDNNNKSIEVSAPTTNNWTADTTYRVTIPTSVKDVNGNDIAKVEFKFTVGTKPVVDAANSSPANFTTDIDVETEYIAVVIDDLESDLQNATLNTDNIQIVKKSDGSVAPYSLDTVNYAKKTTTATATTTSGNATLSVTDEADFVEGDIITIEDATGTYIVTSVTMGSLTLDKPVATSSAGASKAITFHQGVVFKLDTDAELEGSTDYQIIVKDVLDKAGNKADETTIGFKTGVANVELKYVSGTVVDGQTGVAVNKELEFTFNSPIDDTTFTGVSVEANGTALTVDKQYAVKLKAGDNKTIVVEPKGFLVAGSVYSVTFDKTTLKNNAGKTLSTAKTITFQAETSASVKPQIVSAKYYKDAGTNGAVVLTFNTGLEAKTTGNADDILTLGGPFAFDTNKSQFATIADGSTTVTITLATEDKGKVIPGASTIKVKAAGDLKDALGNNVTTATVTITE